MTGLLESALRRVETLSEDEQDAIAAQIIETLDSETSWERSLRERPEVMRSLAREALTEHESGQTRPLDELYGLFRTNPSHPGLNFKKIDDEENVFSARVGLGYRVLGRRDGDEIVWFWIGSHGEYDKML